MSTLRTNTLETLDSVHSFDVADLDQLFTSDAETRASVSHLEKVQSANAPLFFKERVLEVGFRDSTYDTLISTYGYDFLYPQSFAVDTSANELWVLKAPLTGANSWAWIWVYDLTTGARKTTFTTGQQWRESLIIRNSGGNRDVYTIGNANSVIRMRLNTLPADLSTATINSTHSVTGQSFLAFDGVNWYVQDFKTNQGLTSRNVFTVWDIGFTGQTGQVTFPITTTGTLQAYTNYFPKAQGICFHQGSIYVANGGAFDPNNPVHTGAANNAIYLQGIQSLSPQGEKECTALCQPSSFISRMANLVGYTPSLAETEGVYSTGDALYSLQITLGPTDRVDPANAGKGVVLVKELATGDSKVDFTTAARAQRVPFDPIWFQSKCHNSSTQLKNPVTGTDINTFADIVTMMRELALSTYTFGGTNQTITDLNGVAVNVSGRVVRCTNLNGLTFSIECVGATTENFTYFLGGGGTVQSGPFFGDAAYGSNANGEFIRHANGVLECWFSDTAAQTATTASGQLFISSANTTWTYPLAFVAKPVVTVGLNVNTSNAGVAGALIRGTPGNTSVVARAWASTTQPTNCGTMTWRAVGRWK